SMRNIALAPCSPFSVTTDLMKETAKLGRSYGVRLHTHLAETQDEVHFVEERFGMRPLALMESLDWVGSDVWYAHGIYFNDEEIDVLAKTQTGIAHCPISNMKLSSGIARIPELIKAGVPVGLAVDGSASNDGSNLLEEIRVAYLLHRLNGSGSAPTGYEILKLATNGSAKILGRDDIGALAAGKAADLFAINRECLELVGADLDEPNMLGTVGLKKSVDLTIVNGKVVVQDGRLKGIDEERVIGEAKAKVKQYLEK
ncbi:amidohydrolase family protein, partial [Lachnospiraceae bacterium OttesenSCG-928-J05]|nr:amidohydrolase family protein [Lachnospiraceae bacterium OttesenSCG-928-J05]